jgi:DNA polymerase
VSGRTIILASDGDLEGFRQATRRLLAEDVSPKEVIFRLRGEGDLFMPPSDLGSSPESVKLPRVAAELANTALHHQGTDRFAAIYRFLYRSKTERSLAENLADNDAAKVRKLAKSVQRDAHKMHAFVRFKKVGEQDGREQFAAWFEPDHHIVEREAPFFVRRFSNMDWAIVTPRKTAIYRGGEVFFTEGGSREEVPTDDAFEEAWRTYYASIFNPARIMTDAMRAEMPKKYWRNLPEASVIPQLLEQAPRRVKAMADAALSNEEHAKITAKMVRVPPRHNSLDAVAEGVRTCTACPLHCDATQGVPGEGPVDAPLFFLGEQPGDQEDLAGRPFVGPAGQLFDRYLEEVGIDREASYVTNTVKHFKFIMRGKRRIHQSPKAGEIDACAPWLHKEHKLIAPKVTVTLGATALRGFFGRPVTLSRVRGTEIPLPDDIGGVCIPTFHPSYLLRIEDEGQRKVEAGKFVQDLAKARALAFA